MNGPFIVAQASTTGVARDAQEKSVRVIKVTKPLDGQAITIDLGYQQTTKLDLTSVATEKMTRVHIGEKLIILFDNKATVTVEPFFNSMGVPRQDLIVEVPGRVLASSDFAAAFPITTDPSVLSAGSETVPASGASFTNTYVEPLENAPASGASFSNTPVAPLLRPDPLPLLGPDDGIAVTPLTASFTDPPPEVLAALSVQLGILTVGGSGDDGLAGGPGNDTLTGNEGANSFILAQVGSVDTVTDYSFAQGDELDLSGLLDAAFAAGDNINDFVRLQQDGADVTVQVDTTGPSDGANFVNVAVLAGYGSSNTDFVRVVFENQAHQLSA